MSEFEQIATVDEVPTGSRKSVVIDETPALLLHIGNDFYAIEDVCTHDGQPLTDGPLNGCEITCPRRSGTASTCTPASRSACRRPNRSGLLKSKSAATPFLPIPGLTTAIANSALRDGELFSPRISQRGLALLGRNQREPGTTSDPGQAARSLVVTKDTKKLKSGINHGLHGFH